MRGERRNREERGRKLLPFTINLHNFTFSLAAHGSERKTTRSLSSGVRLACEISAITPQKKKRPCRLLSQMLWILFFLITANPQLTDTLSLSPPSPPPPPLPPQRFMILRKIFFQIHDSRGLLITYWLNDFFSGNIVSFCIVFWCSNFCFQFLFVTEH